MFTLVPTENKATKAVKRTVYFSVGLRGPIMGTSPRVAGCCFADSGMG